MDLLIPVGIRVDLICPEEQVELVLSGVLAQGKREGKLRVVDRDSISLMEEVRIQPCSRTVGSSVAKYQRNDKMSPAQLKSSHLTTEVSR